MFLHMVSVCFVFVFFTRLVVDTVAVFHIKKIFGSRVGHQELVIQLVSCFQVVFGIVSIQLDILESILCGFTSNQPGCLGANCKFT